MTAPFIKASLHSQKRAKERIGIPKAATARAAQIALERGKCPEDVENTDLARYLKGKLYADPDVTDIRVHGINVFLFGEDKLITTYPLPREFQNGIVRKKPRR